MPKHTQKYVDFTREEIKNYIAKIKKNVREDNYKVCQNNNREQNVNFIENYHLSKDRRDAILLDLKVDDFCYAVDNKKEGYEDEVLYIFCKKEGLDYWGEIKVVDIYIKTNILEDEDGSYMFVISFHERNKPIEYLF